jgi:hypothetical protein
VTSPAFAIVVSLGLGIALGSASCGPTCPGQQSCGTTSGSSAGAAGSAGSSSSATCAYLTTVQNCLDAFCKTTSNPFCTCYTRGFDLGGDCTCIPFDPQKFCDQAAASGEDSVGYDCSSRTGAVATICVAVQ